MKFDVTKIIESRGRLFVSFSDELKLNILINNLDRTVLKSKFENNKKILFDCSVNIQRYTYKGNRRNMDAYTATLTLK